MSKRYLPRFAERGWRIGRCRFRDCLEWDCESHLRWHTLWLPTLPSPLRSGSGQQFVAPHPGAEAGSQCRAPSAFWRPRTGCLR